ncbi:orotidine-5'-phosphate decarboxylase [Amycolatopsis sp. lyj-23]|uniref:orotidine-5'-phosphate decarboxylase n=1 Tax=Amycolatopsis sp. lyj-23 TaxID=2789283 RepID=UPI00397CFD42
MSTSQAPPISVALDVPDAGRARELYRALRPYTDHFKIGPHLLLGSGPGFVRELADDGAKVFLDLKFHDIPQTVYSSALQACRLRPFMFDVHALTGDEAIRRAVRATRDSGIAPRPNVLAVTVLVSHGPEYFDAYLGGQRPTEDVVTRYAARARQAGVDGIVCSPDEAAAVRAAHGPDFLIVTPGVRFREEQADDHAPHRIATFGDPRLKNSSVLVAGRPIIAAPDPVEALRTAQRLLDEAVTGGADGAAATQR